MGDHMNTTFNDTYEVKSVIGKGGMSTVYLAEHKRLGTRWAVKQVAKQQGAQFDFLAEANILKRLQHPMLPRIVDIFEDDAHIYVVEDFVEGVTLEDVLKQQKRVDEAQGLQWMKDLASALGYLHGQKPHPIIYRDMKPSNVMVQPDGKLKIIDFGIAREYKQESSADTTYIGTRGYAAPEQFGTAQTDARTDIYALGVTMYHLLTGKSPYEPPYQFVPARQLNPALSHGMEYVLGKCVQPEPADRYQDTEQLLDDLEHIYKFDKAWKKYKAVKRTRALVLVLMLAASAALIAGGWITMGQERETAYSDLLVSASGLYTSDPGGAISALEEARALFPDRPETYRQQAYALYLTGDYEACRTWVTEALTRFPGDSAMTLTLASVQYEAGEYEAAAANYAAGAQGSEMSADHIRDYAVCLGRIGQVDAGRAQLDRLEDMGANADVTAYVQGELAYAARDYAAAETHFRKALDTTENASLLRRSYIALAETYRDGGAVIANAGGKQIDLIRTALGRVELQGNAVLYEMLGAAQYNAGDYAAAADSFEKVISLGVQKEYLFVNTFTARQAAGDYEGALKALDGMESAYPQKYTPHALRATLLIMQENAKPEKQRDYKAAYAEYERAVELVKADDDTAQLDQLKGLIDQLKSGGWL